MSREIPPSSGPSPLDRAARRAARQQLSSLRAAGVTGVVRRSGKAASKKRSPTAAELKSGVEAPLPASRAAEPRAAEATPAASASPCALRPAALFGDDRSTVPRADRDERLRILSARVAQCTRCAELAGTRNKTVFGVGNPEARILFVGEAPGAEEDRQGEPFVGAAGQLLNRILEASQLKREDVYICNILRCRPPGNRNPSPEEAANCREYLTATLETVDPDYIVCLGGIAAKYLLGTMESIGKLRGRLMQYGRAKVVCTYHPAYLLRNPAAKKDVWEDMKFLMRDLGVVL